MSSRKLVSFRLPDELMDDLRDRADADGISVTELVCRLLRQGLQKTADESVATLVDERFATLKAQMRQELSQSRQSGINPLAHAPVYAALIPQAQVTYGGDNEVKERLTRLEEMMIQLMNQYDPKTCPSVGAEGQGQQGGETTERRKLDG